MDDAVIPWMITAFSVGAILGAVLMWALSPGGQSTVAAHSIVPGEPQKIVVTRDEMGRILTVEGV